MTQAKRHSIRDPETKKFVSRKPSWTAKGEKGFFNWLSEIKPRILTDKGIYEPIELEPWQQEVITDILVTDKDGFKKYNFCLLCWPKRHSKSIIHALLVLHSLCTKKNWLCVCLANSLVQVQSVNYRLLLDIIRNTPALYNLIGEKNLLTTEIRNPKNNNRILPMSSNPSTVHGLKLSTLWTTELWAANDLRAFRALFASLADTKEGICFLDTVTSFYGGVIEEFEQLSTNDDSMFAHRIEYKDFEEFCEKAPHWVSRAVVRVSKKIDLDQDFARNWLNKKSSSKSSLFPLKFIQQAKSDYKIPVEDIESITQGRSYTITGGLDRAKNLLPGISKSDYTVWTCLLKCVDPASNDHQYHILNQVRFEINLDRNIKKVILADHKKYGLSNVCLEFYEVSSISAFLAESSIQHELISATDSFQNSSFPEMHRIFRDNRFHFSKDLKHFEQELSTFAITLKKAGTYSFGHSSQKFHDDTVHATNLAIWAGRKTVLNIFELNAIQCVNKSVRKNNCFILNRDSNLELLCRERCEAYQEIKAMYLQYLEFQTETELTLPEFFRAYVRTNVIIQQAA